jgi:hypothetical protein
LTSVTFGQNQHLLRLPSRILDDSATRHRARSDISDILEAATS